MTSPGNCWDVFWELDKGLLWISKFEPDKILELSSSDGYLKLKVTSKVKVYSYNCTFFSLICLVDACMHIKLFKESKKDPFFNLVVLISKFAKIKSTSK